MSGKNLYHPGLFLYWTEERNKKAMVEVNVSCALSLPILGANAWRRRQTTSFQVLQRCVLFLTVPHISGQIWAVHELLRQWELSLEGLTKVWSGLGRTVGWIKGWDITGCMCQSKQFVPVCPLPHHHFSPETLHPFLYNLFLSTITSCVSIAWSECYVTYLTRHVVCVIMCEVWVSPGCYIIGSHVCPMRKVTGM